ncbi:MAG: hypothetical protein RL084_79 [Pseudomonadota bacterium]
MRLGKASQTIPQASRHLGWALCVGLSLGVALPTASWASRDAPLSAQERLEAIRMGLMEATLQTPTKVTTTSWIDAQGSLRESSSFKNGMVVKGVRVLAYGRDEAGQAKASLQISPVPEKEIRDKSVSQSTNTSGDCSQKVGAQLSHVVKIDLDIEPTAHPMVLQFLLPQIQALWVSGVNAENGANNAKPWRAVNSLPPPSMANGLTAYERALISTHTQTSPWQASVKIKTYPTPARGFEGYSGYKPAGIALGLEYQMASTDGRLLVLEDDVSIELAIERPSWGAPRVASASAQLVQEQLQNWRAKSEQWLQCQHLNPVVTAVSGQQIQINAGSLAGVRQGEEWLIANPARFPAELASKEGAPQTLLAKVQAVTPYHSQLVILAGPAQAVQANWRAWPTETLIKEPNILPSAQVNTKPVKRPNKPMASEVPFLGFPVN